MERGERRTTERDVSPMRGISVPANDLADIAEKLGDLATQIRDASSGGAPRLGAIPHSPGSKAHLLALARLMYAQRRRRCAIIGGPELFGEPGWDILLDLYIAYAQGKHVSVSSACIGSAAPPTTGLRWLGILQDEGLVEREKDPRDHRRVNVRLSNDGIQKMERYLGEIGS